MIKKALFRRLWVPIFLLVSHCIEAQTFTFNNWYAFSSANVTEADDCGTVFRVNASFNNWSPAHFQILKDGVPLGKSDLVSKISSIYYEANGNDPAWRCAKDNSGQSWSYTFYINTRVTPYEIVSSVPTDPFDASKMTVLTGKTVMTDPAETFTLSGKGCSSVDTASFSYQWMSSTDGEKWTAIKNATSDEYTAKLSKDSVYYALKTTIVHDEISSAGDTLYHVAHEVMSAPVLFSFKPVEVTFSAQEGENSHRFNDAEFEVKEGGYVAFTALSESFSGTPTYTLQYRSLEKASDDAEWSNVTTMKNGKLAKFIPDISAEYRVKVTGTSKYSGKKATVYSSEVIVVRKIYLVDTEKFEYDVLWSDDFGYFSSAMVYHDALGNEYNKSIKDPVSGKSCTIENYWAPDPFDYVKEHQYAAFDPNFINNTRDWCSKYRLEDGYYIITNNPYKGDGKNDYKDRDYWEGEDHTPGDQNGAMLFVNCKGGLEGALIYERKLSLKCELDKTKGVWVIFSAFLNNAVYKLGSETPVNVRLEIVDPDGKVVHSISSGDINQRKGSFNQGTWANLSFRFLAEAQDYTIRLYNNAPGGANWGNDILLDDISVTLCYPKVYLLTRDEKRSDFRNACKGDAFELIAYNEDGLDKYIGNPKFLYQYANAKTDFKWKNYGKITTDSVLKIKTSDDLLGVTVFRVIVASEESVIKSLAEDKKVELSCATVYAINDKMVISVSQPFDLALTLSDSLLCLGQDSVMASTARIQRGVDPYIYYWYLDGVLQDSTAIPSYVYRGEKGASLFDKVGSYEMEVRAIDSVCPEEFTKKKWADSNKAYLEVVNRTKLGLSVAESNLSFGQPALFTIDLDNYNGDSLVWYEDGGIKKSYMTEAMEGERSVQIDQNGRVAYHISATDQYVCVDPSDTILLNVDFSIPNLITPYDDGASAMNNTFMVGKGVSVQIFNRYQQLIFEGDNGWDGMYKGKVAEPGTYFYKAILPNGETRKGTLEVGKFSK